MSGIVYSMETKALAVVIFPGPVMAPTPEQAAAIVLCPVCGEPSDGAIYPCGHSLENVRKCC